MLLGFKPRFEQYVREGSKTHTIRQKRVVRPKIGQRCDCYGDVRQRTMHLLGRWPCTKVEDIRFIPTDNPRWRWIMSRMEESDEIEGLVFETLKKAAYDIRVFVGEAELDDNEKDMLAWRDGFRHPDSGSAGCFPMMITFWLGMNGRLKTEWLGDMVHWDYEHPIVLPGDAEKMARGRK